MDFHKYQTALNDFFNNVSKARRSATSNAFGDKSELRSLIENLKEDIEQEKTRLFYLSDGPFELSESEKEVRKFNKQLLSLLEDIGAYQMNLDLGKGTYPLSQDELMQLMGEEAYLQLVELKTQLVGFLLFLQKAYQIYLPNLQPCIADHIYTAYFNELPPNLQSFPFNRDRLTMEINDILASKDFNRIVVLMDQAKNFVRGVGNEVPKEGHPSLKNALEQIQVLENLRTVRHFQDALGGLEYELDELWGDMAPQYETIVKALEARIQPESEELPLPNQIFTIADELNSLLTTSSNIAESTNVGSLPRRLHDWVISERDEKIQLLFAKAKENDILMKGRIPTKLTAAELAYLFRSLDDAGFIEPRNATEMSKTLSKLFTSKHKDTLKDTTIRNNYEDPKRKTVENWSGYYSTLHDKSIKKARELKGRE